MFKFYWDVQKSTSKFTVTFKNKNIMKSVDFIEVIQIIKYQDGGQRQNLTTKYFLRFILIYKALEYAFLSFI